MSLQSSEDGVKAPPRKRTRAKRTPQEKKAAATPKKLLEKKKIRTMPELVQASYWTIPCFNSQYAVRWGFEALKNSFLVNPDFYFPFYISLRSKITLGVFAFVIQAPIESMLDWNHPQWESSNCPGSVWYSSQDIWYDRFKSKDRDGKEILIDPIGRLLHDIVHNPKYAKFAEEIGASRVGPATYNPRTHSAMVFLLETPKASQQPKKRGGRKPKKESSDKKERKQEILEQQPKALEFTPFFIPRAHKPIDESGTEPLRLSTVYRCIECYKWRLFDVPTDSLFPAENKTGVDEQNDAYGRPYWHPEYDQYTILKPFRPKSRDEHLTPCRHGCMIFVCDEHKQTSQLWKDHENGEKVFVSSLAKNPEEKFSGIYPLACVTSIEEKTKLLSIGGAIDPTLPRLRYTTNEYRPLNETAVDFSIYLSSQSQKAEGTLMVHARTQWLYPSTQFEPMFPEDESELKTGK